MKTTSAQGRPFVLILSASGSGKSSLAIGSDIFLYSGLYGSCGQELLVKPSTIEGVGLWRRVVFRPGGQTEAGDLFDRLV